MRILRRSTFFFLSSVALLTGVALAVIGAQATPLGPWLGLLAPVVVYGWGLRRAFRRWRVARRPLPEAWRRWLAGHVPLYRHLDETARARFERDVRFFMDEMTFEAVEGVELTDTLRLAVAAGAALLVHGRPDWELNTTRTILFYPDRFDEDYFETYAADYDGMVHPQGPIILSVKAVEEGWEHPGNGDNVVLHELAHLFDFDNAFADGVPSLMDPASAPAWARLVRREMRKARLGRSMLRRYAATNPAEFFAVAVENFFERPRAMAHRHPELFEALKAFFNYDPRLPVGEEDPVA
ncbi:zinc-dependent peptidase [Rhodocaloribacter litoris]|uniref:zinc-dependent peptidase n=1 Tax=Rhodocaloribacter litoris TaxID=2558931 RepID=UPI001421BC1B|nr:zinc-dependent peptidase [Rhodocaloribacter litoris]QXD16011.1 zinc-dependent peptidase [Rhodocaloribacter litoris]